MRDRDETGRPRNARPRDELGRPLPRGSVGVPELPQEIAGSPDDLVALADALLDRGRVFQAHEVLEAGWKASPPEQRAGWQGLAQLAVAVTHLLRGNQQGAVRVHERALTNLQGADLPASALALRDRLLDDWEVRTRSSDGRNL